MESASGDNEEFRAKKKSMFSKKFFLWQALGSRGKLQFVHKQHLRKGVFPKSIVYIQEIILSLFLMVKLPVTAGREL